MNNIKVKYTIDSPIIKGLEKVQKIDILENGVIIIQYSITDEYMKEYDLYNKNRLLKIDSSQTEEYKIMQDYANIMRGVENNE